MAEESKQVDPTKEREAQVAVEALLNLASGKQAAAESEESGSEPEDEAAQNAGAAGGGEEGAAKKKKKKSKKKKAKQALTEALAESSAAQAMIDPKKAIEGLTPKQISEFISLNPALANELLGGDGSSGSTSTASAIEAFKQLKLQDIMTGLASSGKNRKDMASYKFWSTQPVPQFGEDQRELIEEGPLKVQDVKDIATEPIPLALEQFRWVTMDLTNDQELEEVEKLLYGHYVEDDEAMFRFKYSASLLRWYVAWRAGTGLEMLTDSQVSSIPRLEERVARRDT